VDSATRIIEYANLLERYKNAVLAAEKDKEEAKAQSTKQD
jgi:hypothetical protein